MRAIFTAVALVLALPMAGCDRFGSSAEQVATIPVTIEMEGKAHKFDV